MNKYVDNRKLRYSIYKNYFFVIRGVIGGKRKRSFLSAGKSRIKSNKSVLIIRKGTLLRNIKYKKSSFEYKFAEKYSK